MGVFQQILTSYNSVVYDTDAQAFFSATGITDTTIKNAVNTFVLGLKTDSLWAGIYCLYPYVGGDASKHAVNLKTPGTYNLTFYGGWTHGSNGILANGSNSYADTGFNVETVLGTGHGAHGCYNRVTFASGTNIHGCSDASDVRRFDFGYDGGVATFFSATGNTNSDTASDSDSTKLLISTRQATSENDGFRDNVLKINGTTTFTENANYSYYIGARNNATTIDYFDNDWELGLSFISDGLDNTEVSNLTTRVNTLMTTLSRNV